MSLSEKQLPEQVQDVDVDSAHVDTLHKNALGLPGILFFCIAGAAPIAAMFFNVPTIASQAGASTPLVFLLSAIGLLMLAVTIVYFSRRLNSAGGFYTWISHGLGSRTAFLSGWLMLGGYAIFEAASQAAFGGLTDNTLATFLNFHIPGGWLTYSLLGTLIVALMAYFDVKWSTLALAPFMIIEIGSLVLFDLVITIKGGVSGHDFVHTFTTAGANLKGVSPGGALGIGIAMALGVWSWVGFESGAAMAEETRNPRRNVPIALFSVIAGLAVLYLWTTYSAIIGMGWMHAGDTLGNIANAPGPYFDLATKYVGGWLVVVMLIAISVGTFSANLTFHNGMVRYFYAMGREQILPGRFGKTHPRWKSPYVASIFQSVFTALVLLFLGLVIQHTNKDGSVNYALGIASNADWQQTNGISSYGWLAIIGTICFIVVYILVNIASPVYAWKHKEFNVFTHIVAPVISTLALLIPLVSFIMPPIPGIGDFFTNLGFAPTPFPLNILPLFPIVWVLIGTGYSIYLKRKSPLQYERMGHIVRGDDASDTDVLSTPANETVTPVNETATPVNGTVPADTNSTVDETPVENTTEATLDEK
ncbi:amino acid permease [Dictyobacter alpinus]|uniref:Amino acid permease n=1 Tax=Dictyobacter alpinus TaxID=2014873 RepID=A0A402BK03_9CHLR|nr:APC family permease [Dictyobacter alpinus]GCE31682.1 amino acid permease [Dictyobacter alpinus]